MHALDELDRTAILLRYFENKPLKEVGQTLGTNEDAEKGSMIENVQRRHLFFSTLGTKQRGG